MTQPKVSALRHYKVAGFSVERQMTLLTALDQRVPRFQVVREPAATLARRESPEKRMA